LSLGGIHEQVSYDVAWLNFWFEACLCSHVISIMKQIGVTSVMWYLTLLKLKSLSRVLNSKYQ
jgi:hypothetical protein